MAGCKNCPPKVVTKPTGKVGGTNASVKASKSPTIYKGGKNKNLVKVKGK